MTLSSSVTLSLAAALVVLPLALVRSAAPWRSGATPAPAARQTPVGTVPPVAQPTPTLPAAKREPVRTAPPAAARPAPPGLNWDDAEALRRKIARIERRLRTGRPAADGPVAVSQREINSFFNLTMAERIPAGVSDLELLLMRDAVEARARVDLDRLKGQLPTAASGVLLLLSGTVPVEVRGKVVAVEGAGRLEVERATVGGMSLPPSLVVHLVSVSTRTAARPQGVDLLAPFPLPWTAREVRVEPGRLLVTFAAKAQDRP